MSQERSEQDVIRAMWVYKDLGGFIRWCYVVDSEVVAELRAVANRPRGDLSAYWYGAAEARTLHGATFEECTAWIQRKVNRLAKRRKLRVVHDTRNPFANEVARWRREWA